MKSRIIKVVGVALTIVITTLTIAFFQADKIIIFLGNKALASQQLYISNLVLDKLNLSTLSLSNISIATINKSE